MAFLASVASTKPATVKAAPVGPEPKAAVTEQKAIAPVDPAAASKEPTRTDVKVPALILGGNSLSTALAEAESALAAITPPKVATPTGDEIAQAASLRQVEDWAQAQIELQKNEQLQRPAKATPVNTRI